MIFLLCLPLEIISRQGKVSSPLPKVFAMESSFSSFIQSNVKCLKRRYNEPLLIKLLGPNIHFLLSTILLPQLIYRERIRFVRELISTKDGGIVGIDWVLFPTDDSLKRSIGMEEENEDRIVMIIPDPSEGRFSHLHLMIQGMKQFAHKMFIFSPRGTRGIPLTSSILPSYSDPSDLRMVIDFILSTEPSSFSSLKRRNRTYQRKLVTTISAVSFSSGADLLMAYLGEFGSSSHIDSAVCISPLFQPKQVLEISSFPSSNSFTQSTYLPFLHHIQPIHSSTTCLNVLTHTKGFSNIVSKVKLLSARIFLLKHIHCLPKLKMKQVLFEGNSLKYLYSEIFSKYSLQHWKKQEERGKKRRTEGEPSFGGIEEGKNKERHSTTKEGIGNEGKKCHQKHDSEKDVGEDEEESAGIWIKDSCREYWDQNDPLRDVDDVSVPVLFIKSQDDPLVPESAVPFGLFQSYPNLILISTATGSHCGFISSLNSHSFTSWAEDVAVEFFSAYRKFSSIEREEKRNKYRSRAKGCKS